MLDSSEGLFNEVQQIATKYAGRCDKEKVISKSYWNKARASAAGVPVTEDAGAKSWNQS